LISDEETLGKPSGNDIIEGTYTLPILIALEKYPEKIKTILSDVHENKIGVDEIISEFNNDEIISESKLFLKTHLEKSESFAIKIDNKEVRNILLDVNKYLVERSN
jgi:geranylgeranyl pyrophosphate synthase